jgi:spore coat polysaccharide biosynthesis protein SpsF (cytidylyltransferase family)
MKVVGIIQARMTSSRLPGKVLMEVAGKPLLQWQVERLGQSEMIDTLCIATTTNEDDRPVQTLAGAMGVPCYRGSEADVLDRMYQAAREAGAEHVVRLTGDCPLVDVAVCDSLIRFYLAAECDYAHTASTFAEGLDCEIMSFAALESAWRNAKMTSEREHVTLYIRNSGKFSCRCLENVEDEGMYRITVDEKADFEVVRYLFERLKNPVTDGFGEVRKLLDEAPEIFALNSEIIRNEGVQISLKNDGVLVTDK